MSDNKPEVHFSLGSVYMATGKNAEAVAEFQSALKLAPNSDEGYRRLGSAWRAAGHKDEALAAYQHSVDLNPYYWLNYAMLGFRRVGLRRERQSAGRLSTRDAAGTEHGPTATTASAVVYFQAQPMGAVHSRVPEGHGDRAGRRNFLESRHGVLLPAPVRRRHQGVSGSGEAGAPLSDHRRVILADAYRASWAGGCRARSVRPGDYPRARRLSGESPQRRYRWPALRSTTQRRGDTTRALEFIHQGAHARNPTPWSILDDEAIVQRAGQPASASARGGPSRSCQGVLG